jgi:hypothetical protein
MLLYKPSDNTSSDPVEFWYLPTPSTVVPRPSVFKQPQQGLELKQKTSQKRPKQRTGEEDESTGRIFLLLK